MAAAGHSDDHEVARSEPQAATNAASAAAPRARSTILRIQRLAGNRAVGALLRGAKATTAETPSSALARSLAATDAVAVEALGTTVLTGERVAATLAGAGADGATDGDNVWVANHRASGVIAHELGHIASGFRSNQTVLRHEAADHAELVNRLIQAPDRSAVRAFAIDPEHSAALQRLADGLAASAAPAARAALAQLVDVAPSVLPGLRYQPSSEVIAARAGAEHAWDALLQQWERGALQHALVEPGPARGVRPPSVSRQVSEIARGISRAKADAVASLASLLAAAGELARLEEPLLARLAQRRDGRLGMARQDTYLAQAAPRGWAGGATAIPTSQTAAAPERSTPRPLATPFMNTERLAALRGRRDAVLGDAAGNLSAARQAAVFVRSRELVIAGVAGLGADMTLYDPLHDARNRVTTGSRDRLATLGRSLGFRATQAPSTYGGHQWGRVDINAQLGSPIAMRHRDRLDLSWLRPEFAQLIWTGATLRATEAGPLSLASTARAKLSTALNARFRDHSGERLITGLYAVGQTARWSSGSIGPAGPGPDQLVMIRLWGSHTPRLYRLRVAFAGAVIAELRAAGATIPPNFEPFVERDPGGGGDAVNLATPAMRAACRSVHRGVLEVSNAAAQRVLPLVRAEIAHLPSPVDEGGGPAEAANPNAVVQHSYSASSGQVRIEVLYDHLRDVRPSGPVSEGTIIGHAGMSGNASQCHVHMLISIHPPAAAADRNGGERSAPVSVMAPEDFFPPGDPGPTTGTNPGTAPQAARAGSAPTVQTHDPAEPHGLRISPPSD